MTCITEFIINKYLLNTKVSGKIVVQLSPRPGEAIVALAKEHRASLIVTGTRGLGSVRRTILGSVSDFVLHHAHCPVLVCRQ